MRKPEYVPRHARRKPPRRRNPHAGLIAGAYLTVMSALVGIGWGAVVLG